MFITVFAVVSTSAYVLVRQRNGRGLVWQHPSVFIWKEIRILPEFKDLPQVLVAVPQLLARTCAGRNQTVTAVFFLQRQYAPAGPERLGRILHDTLHVPEIVKHDVVYC